MEKKLFLIGGWVRDELIQKYHPELKIEPHDKDYVAIGYTEKEMDKLYGRKHGKQFPVWVDKDGNEIALARTERKIGDKHTDFVFDFNKDITLEDDLVRRDFTVNAIAKDEDGNYIDPYNSVRDIKNKILRAVRPETFVEDPLRVLRLCRFSAQLGFNIEVNTLLLCKNMVKQGMLDHLTPERIWGEFEKALNTDHFDTFIETMKWTGALKVVLPEVEQLFNTPENINHHPEGNTGEHTLLTLKRVNDKTPIIKFGMLLHDVGKGITPKEELPKHYGHDERGTMLIYDICSRLKVPNEYKKFALYSCRYHMRLRRLYEMKPGHIYDIVEDITDCFRNDRMMKDLLVVSKADMYGRGKEPSDERKKEITISEEIAHNMYRVLKDVKANKFPELLKYNGEEFGKMLRVKKIQYYLDNKDQLCFNFDKKI